MRKSRSSRGLTCARARERERESSDWRPRERRENFGEKRENELVREKERNLFDLGQRDFGKFRLLVWEGGSSPGFFFFWVNYVFRSCVKLRWRVTCTSTSIVKSSTVTVSRQHKMRLFKNKKVPFVWIWLENF